MVCLSSSLCMCVFECFSRCVCVSGGRSGSSGRDPSCTRAWKQVCKELIEAFCRGEETSEAGLRALGLKRLSALQLEWLKKSDLGAAFALSLSASDMAGAPTAPEPGSRRVKYLRVTLQHIQSLDMTPVDLGAVVFGESFVEVPGEGGAPGAACVLTVGIEQHAGWMSAGQEEDTEVTKHQRRCAARWL